MKRKKLSTEEQLKIIRKVMGESYPDYRFKKGKHNGKSLCWVAEYDLQYLYWLLSEDFMGPTIRGFIQRAIDIAKEE